MQPFGMSTDALKTRLANMVRPSRVIFTEKQYNVSYLGEGDNLYSVTSSWQGLPNFMVWQDDLVGTTRRTLSSKTVLDMAAPYIANMTDEEVELFKPIITQLIALYGVYRIAVSPDTIEFITIINGKPKLLLVTVMNMIDTASRNPDRIHWRSRSCLN